MAFQTLFHSVFCYEFPFWVQFWWFICATLMQGHHIQPIVFELCFEPFFQFSITSYRVLVTSTSLEQFLQWALEFSLMVGKFAYCGHSDPILIVFFAMDFFLGSVLVVQLIQASISCKLCRVTRLYDGFLFRLRSISLFGHNIAITLG